MSLVGGRTARRSSDLLMVAAAGVYDRPGDGVKVGRDSNRRPPKLPPTDYLLE
jgi:hypothetical protein